MNPSSFFAVVFLAILTARTNCLIENEAKEQPCFEITKTASVDVKWIESLKTLYYPMMSFLELYRSSQNLLQSESKDITLSQVFYDSCIELNPINGSYTFRGFAGRTSNLNLEVLSPGFEKMKMRLSYSGISATCYSTLTDNGTFVFVPCCHSDNQMSWGVVSSLPSLRRDTVKLIQEHAMSLGFRKEFFTELRYESCPDIAGRTGCHYYDDTVVEKFD